MKNITIAILMIAFCANLFLFDLAQSNENEVYEAQKRLKELGYDPGAIDGIWGKKKLMVFQRIFFELALWYFW